jgi:hypothetical protein
MHKQLQHKEAAQAHKEAAQAHLQTGYSYVVYCCDCCCYYMIPTTIAMPVANDTSCSGDNSSAG